MHHNSCRYKDFYIKLDALIKAINYKDKMWNYLVKSAIYKKPLGTTVIRTTDKLAPKDEQL